MNWRSYDKLFVCIQILQNKNSFLILKIPSRYLLIKVNKNSNEKFQKKIEDKKWIFHKCFPIRKNFQPKTPIFLQKGEMLVPRVIFIIWKKNGKIETWGVTLIERSKFHIFNHYSRCKVVQLKSQWFFILKKTNFTAKILQT